MLLFPIPQAIHCTAYHDDLNRPPSELLICKLHTYTRHPSPGPVLEVPALELLGARFLRAPPDPHRFLLYFYCVQVQVRSCHDVSAKSRTRPQSGDPTSNATSGPQADIRGTSVLCCSRMCPFIYAGVFGWLWCATLALIATTCKQKRLPAKYDTEKKMNKVRVKNWQANARPARILNKNGSPREEECKIKKSMRKLYLTGIALYVGIVWLVRD